MVLFARGRGTGIDPPNRFESLSLHVLSEHVQEVMAEAPDGRQIRTQVYYDRSRTVLNRVDVPDLPFNWTVNPYRGCEHGCIYCYARPGHEYLGLSCGLEFETKIIAKPQAAELLRAELMKPSWQGEPIVLSGVTDPYQPIEANLRITRAVLEVCREFSQPVSLITKSRLITRDLDLFADMASHESVHAAVSLTTLDNDLAQWMEPRASAPRARLAAIRELADAGIPVTAMLAPIIPGVNDREVPALLTAAKQAGAGSAAFLLLRLPYQVKDLFLEWLIRHFPGRAAHIESLVRQTRDGALYDSNIGKRHTGTGAVAEAIGDTFRLLASRHGLDKPRQWSWQAASGGRSPFRRPGVGEQLKLF